MLPREPASHGGSRSNATSWQRSTVLKANYVEIRPSRSSKPFLHRPNLARFRSRSPIPGSAAPTYTSCTETWIRGWRCWQSSDTRCPEPFPLWRRRHRVVGRRSCDGDAARLGRHLPRVPRWQQAYLPELELHRYRFPRVTPGIVECLGRRTGRPAPLPPPGSRRPRGARGRVGTQCAALGPRPRGEGRGD